MDNWKIEEDSFYKDLINRQEEIILQNLKLLGIDIDLELESQRRFPSLMREKQGNKTTWYYNNGSVDGLKIATFEIIIDLK